MDDYQGVKIETRILSMSDIGTKPALFLRSHSLEAKASALSCFQRLASSFVGREALDYAAVQMTDIVVARHFSPFIYYIQAKTTSTFILFNPFILL